MTHFSGDKYDGWTSLFPHHWPSFVPYLEEVDVVVSVWKPLQLGVGPPKLDYLSLYLLQQVLSLTDSCSLLDSDQVLHLTALFLHGADQLGENPIALLHCCFCGVLWRIKLSLFLVSRNHACLTFECRQCVNNIFKAPILKKIALTLMYLTTYLSSFSVSFNFCTDFKEASWSFFWEHTKDEYHTVRSLRLLGRIFLPRLTFKMESFRFHNQKDWIALEGLWSINLNFWHNIRAQDMASRPGHILHSLYSIFEKLKPSDQAVKDRFILDTRYTNLARLLSQSAVKAAAAAVTCSSWGKSRTLKPLVKH